MNNKVSPAKKIARQEVKYASYYLMIGLTAMAIDLLVFYLLNKSLNIFPIVANTVSVSVATIFGFFANQKYNFQISDNLIKRFFSYASVSVFGLILGNVLIYLMNSVWGYDSFLAKVISLPIVVGLQYLINRFVSFNEKAFVGSGRSKSIEQFKG
jgi:putative flippase GtrA